MIVSDLTKRLEGILSENPKTSEYRIEVLDENGLVTLKGEVDSVEVREMVERMVKEQPGVITLISDLEISEENGNDPDLTIPRLIRGRLE